MKSYIMKYISFAILVVGIIGSIISGAVFQTYNFEKQKFVFNVELTIIGIIMILLLSFIFFTFSTVLEKLETLEILQLKMLKQNDKTIKNKVEAAVKMPVIQSTANESTSSHYVNAEDLTNNKLKKSESTNEQKNVFPNNIFAIVIVSVLLVLLLVTLLLK